MKFAHFADIHLGYEQYHQNWRADDFARVFREAVEIAINERVDFAIIAGDLFHRSTPNPKTIKEAIDILTMFKENKIPVFAIEGNHDKTIRDVSIYNLLESLGLLYVLGLRKKKIEGEYVRSVKIGNVYLVKGYFDGVEIIGDTHRTRWQLEKILPVLKSESDEWILVLHQAIREVADANMDYELTLSELPKATYYALGHIHTPRIFEYEGRYVVYPGCPERYDAKEASLVITCKDDLRKIDGVKKGFFIVDDYTPRFVELNPRNMVTAYIEASDPTDAKEKLIKVLNFVGPEDILLAEVVSEAHIDATKLNEIATAKTAYTRVNFKLLRSTFEKVEFARESEFFNEFELELLNHLREDLSEIELKAAVDLVKRHYGLEDTKLKEADEKSAPEVKPEKKEAIAPAVKKTPKRKGPMTLLDFLGGE